MGEFRERGQASVALVGVLALTIALLLALGRLGVDTVRRAQVDAAADAVALSAVTAGREAAVATAAANGVQIERLDLRPAWAQVTVRRGGHRATSTAALVARTDEARPAGEGDRSSGPS
jgi:hypothetical protein